MITHHLLPNLPSPFTFFPLLSLTSDRPCACTCPRNRQRWGALVVTKCSWLWGVWPIVSLWSVLGWCMRVSECGRSPWPFLFLYYIMNTVQHGIQVIIFVSFCLLWIPLSQVWLLQTFWTPNQCSSGQRWFPKYQTITILFFLFWSFFYFYFSNKHYVEVSDRVVPRPHLNL